MSKFVVSKCFKHLRRQSNTPPNCPHSKSFVKGNGKHTYMEKSGEKGDGEKSDEGTSENSFLTSRPKYVSVVLKMEVIGGGGPVGGGGKGMSLLCGSLYWLLSEHPRLKKVNIRGLTRCISTRFGVIK